MARENKDEKRHIINVYYGTSEKNLERRGYKNLTILHQFRSHTSYWCEKIGEDMDNVEIIL